MMLKKIGIISLLIISSLMLSGCGDKSFSLENKYYMSDTVTEIEKEDLDKLINDKESFIVFIYQPLCAASSAFENVLNEFIDEYHISFYKMSFTNMKETFLGDEIKYYPSFIVFNKGEMIDYLDANSEVDKEYYQDVLGFSKWIKKYVKWLDKYKNRMDKKLEEIVYDEEKVNIYFFWGNGCPHCEEEHEFFEEIENEYGKYYNLNTFEVWYNEDNLKIYEEFALKMGDEADGVPYTIIGNKTISGFSDAAKKKIKNAIVEQHKNSYDVYFDLKKEVQE